MQNPWVLACSIGQATRKGVCVLTADPLKIARLERKQKLLLRAGSREAQGREGGGSDQMQERLRSHSAGHCTPSYDTASSHSV